MVQDSTPESILIKVFDYNSELDIINSVADTVATYNFNGIDADCINTIRKITIGDLVFGHVFL